MAPHTFLRDSFDCHTPMVDFRCSSPEDAIHSLERMGINITESGIILVDSGNSFHAHFPRVVHDTEGTWKHLEGLVGSGEVCDKWVPLQKEQGYQLLRVSPCLSKPKMPVILDL